MNFQLMKFLIFFICENLNNLRYLRAFATAQLLFCVYTKKM